MNIPKASTMHASGLERLGHHKGQFYGPYASSMVKASVQPKVSPDKQFVEATQVNSPVGKRRVDQIKRSTPCIQNEFEDVTVLEVVKKINKKMDAFLELISYLKEGYKGTSNHASLVSMEQEMSLGKVLNLTA